jgi:hypothetical protein
MQPKMKPEPSGFLILNFKDMDTNDRNRKADRVRPDATTGYAQPRRGEEENDTHSPLARSETRWDGNENPGGAGSGGSAVNNDEKEGMM